MIGINVLNSKNDNDNDIVTFNDGKVEELF